MSTEEIKALDDNLKLQTAALISTNVMLGALISVVTEEQFLELTNRYLQDVQQLNANLKASVRGDREEWHALMEKMQLQLLAQVQMTREDHGSLRN